MKSLQVILLFSLLIVCFSASTPAKNSIPTELTASIEKKWPGSKTVLAASQSEIDNNTILYKIVLNNDQIGWAYTRRVLSCRNGGCKESDSPDDRNVSHEYFEYYAVLNTQYSIIEIKVYNYAATHGEEICSKAWLKQFKGYDGSKNLRYGKDIDAISGATISGIAITEDIGSTVIMLRK